MSRRATFLLCLLVLGAYGCAGESTQSVEAYVQAIEQHRAEREERLRSENGWLTLVGLNWLTPGENRFGSDPDNEIVLEAPGVPAWAGTLDYDGSRVRLEPRPGAGLTVNGEPADERILADDTQESRDQLGLGRLRFYVIRREDRHGVRVKDAESPSRIGFTGLDYFPIDPSRNVDAIFRPYEEPREVRVPTVIGTAATMLAPGTLEFSLGGRQHTLEPLIDTPEEKSFFLIIKDLTSGHETYGAGRYLSAELQEGGRVELDFNKAYNPPCAFTPYATCPLPPKENSLDARIEAGEKAFVH